MHHENRAQFSSELLTVPLVLAAASLAACTPMEPGAVEVDEVATGEIEAAEDVVLLPSWMGDIVLEIGEEGSFDDFAQPERPDSGEVPPMPDDGRDYLLAQGHDGPQWIPYFERDGWLWAAEDMAIGPASMLEQRSAAVPVGLRWPYALVNYDFEKDMSISHRVRVVEALAKLSAASPLRFVENSNPTKKVTFVCWDKKIGAANGIGMQVDGQKIKLPCAPAFCASDPNCNPSEWLPSHKTIIHEMLHTVGFWHEQNRVGASAFVEYHPECKDPAYDKENFLPVNGLMHTGPYDVDSMLHYGGWSLSKPSSDDWERCPTLTYTRGPQAGEPVSPTHLSCSGNGPVDCYMSAFDQQGIYRAYGAFYFSHTHDFDYMGYATAVGDFNGDGQDDLVSTAPFKDGGYGQAFVYMGIYGNDSNTWSSGEPGLVPWKVLTPHEVSDDVSPYAYFGASAAVGDFNDDGFDDLAIGAPNEAGTGAVYLWEGSALGLVARERIVATLGAGGLPVANASYGLAVGFADVDDDGKDELLVGAPGDMADFGQPKCGGVYVYDLNNASHFKMRWSPTGGSCRDGAEAGFSIAKGRWIAGVGREVIVGAPGSHSNTGRVYVMRRSGSTLAVQQTLSQWTTESCSGGIIYGPSPLESGDRFGASVAADVRSGKAVIAVGSPGEDSGTGRVDVFSRPGNQCWAREVILTQAGIGVDEPGDAFGTSLAFGDVNGDGVTDLLVGAPGEAVGNATPGWVYAYGGYQSGFGAMYGFGQSTGGWNDGNGERYGQSIAIGHFDRVGADIVVGAPGNHSGTESYAGAFFLWRAKNAVMTPTPWRAYSIETKSPDAP